MPAVAGTWTSVITPDDVQVHRMVPPEQSGKYNGAMILRHYDLTLSLKTCDTRYDILVLVQQYSSIGCTLGKKIIVGAPGIGHLACELTPLARETDMWESRPVSKHTCTSGRWQSIRR